MTDIELIKQCLQHDNNSQKMLYDRYSGQMYAICLRYCKQTFEAQEALQIGFINVFRNLHNFEGRSMLGTWIRSIIIRACLDQLKNSKKDKLRFDELDINRHDTGIENYESMTYNELKGLISQLPTGLRTVFNMYVLDEMSHAEIASILNITESTSRTQLLKARKHLMSKLSTQEKHYL